MKRRPRARLKVPLFDLCGACGLPKINCSCAALNARREKEPSGKRKAGVR